MANNHITTNDLGLDLIQGELILMSNRGLKKN